MTVQWWFIMRIKPTSAYGDMWIYYTIRRHEPPYMFQPTAVAIFMEVFFDGYITENIKTNLRI